MSIRANTPAHHTARSIRQQLKEAGIKPKSVSASPGQLNSTVKIKLLDTHPDAVRTAIRICTDHQTYVPDPEQPGISKPNPRGDLPKVTTVEVTNCLSDDLYHGIAQYIRAHTPDIASLHTIWDRFEGAVMDFWEHAAA